MLYRISQDRNHVVMPFIDSIDADNFEFQSGGIDILAFSWTLGQRPAPPRKRESPTGARTFNHHGRRSLCYRPQTISGDRRIDPEMRIYGGEEVEISFRIWQCGMTLEGLPWLGHIFEVPSIGRAKHTTSAELRSFATNSERRRFRWTNTRRLSTLL